MSQRDCVATPVGQRPVWQRWAWMQPIESIASRPTLIRSQPSANANSAESGKPSRPAPIEDHVLGEAGPGEGAVHAREAELERQRHVVGERERRGAGAALAAVDSDEVRSAAGARHALGERLPEAGLADGGLDAHREAGVLRDLLDELDQLVDVGEGGVRGRADAVLAGGHAADGGDLGGDLDAGQQSAEPRLGAL